MNKFYLTTPLYYPNARPHVGSAYTTIACDAIARYKRMCGYDVAFLTGTDEHGEKLERAAAAAGMTPAAFVAEKRELFRDLWKLLGIDYTHFVYTDQPDHVKSVQRMLVRARDAGYIDKRRYEGRYCIFDEMYVSEGSEPVDCPNCGRPAELISEDNYFFRLSAFQDRLLKLYEGRPDFVQPDFRMNEVKSFVKSGLRDISVSRRRIKWGIPWPDDPEQVFYVWYDALTGYLTGIGFAEDGSNEAKRRREQGFWEWWPDEGPFDPGDGRPHEKTVVHMIGKDILRFHAVYWPAFLWAAGMELPKTIFAHGWIYYEQDKMSKSKGNVVYPEPIIKAFEEFGAPGNDALRYYLLRDTPFGLDGSFSYEGLIQRYNSDLANGLGNLAKRTIHMIEDYCGGKVPERGPAIAKSQRYEILHSIFLTDVEGARDNQGNIGKGQILSFYDVNNISRAAESTWSLVSEVDKFLAREAPWKTHKRIIQTSQGLISVAQVAANVTSDDLAPTKDSEKGRHMLDDVLYTAADILRAIAVLAYPLIPESAQKLWQQLGCEGSIENQRFSDLKWGGLKPGTKVGKPEPIFPRLDKEKTLARLHELAEEDRAKENKSQQDAGATRSAAVPAAKGESIKEALKHVEQETAKAPIANPQPPTPNSQPPAASEQSPIVNHQSSIPKITIDDFAKIDLRAGTILSAEPIPGATKLLKLQVDIGSEVRQVCAGIAEYYKPEEIVGMKIVLVANLQPRKLRGVESNGMVVAASMGENGKPILATFKEDVPNGTKLR